MNPAEQAVRDHLERQGLAPFDKRRIYRLRKSIEPQKADEPRDPQLYHQQN
jgi:hypothetical protein